MPPFRVGRAALRPGLVAVSLAAALVLVGCGGSARPPGSAEPPAGAAPTGSAPAGASTRPTPPPAAPRTPAPPLAPARCTAPPGANCTAHTGTVIALQSVDPDGDGDLHVIATGGSVTARGVTVFDVSRALRPARDPRPGDRVTGAGPVYRGSFHQRQIQVTTFRVARAAG